MSVGVKIKPVAAEDHQLRQMIKTHADFCREHTPPGSGHAVTTESSQLAEIRYWLAVQGEIALGCIGLRRLGTDHAEIKTMHVTHDRRGRGTGTALLQAVMTEAERTGIKRISLETGRSEAFQASRQLYAKHSFQECSPFGPYAADPFSFCMTRSLIPPST